MSSRRTRAMVALVILAAVAATYVVARRPKHPPVQHTLPIGTPGPDADGALSVLNGSVQASAWASTGAVRWTIAHGTSHLWDRTRHLDAQTLGDNTVLLNLAARSGRAWHGTTELSGNAATAALGAAWTAWVHDSFWLHPLERVSDAGVTHGLATLPDGRRALLATFSHRSMDPPGSVLFIPGIDHRPVTSWLWLPETSVPGLEVSWEGWMRLRTGAWVSTLHRGGDLRIELRNVEGDRTLRRIAPGPDPFARIVTR